MNAQRGLTAGAPGTLATLDYREPLALRPGELPADLLARLAEGAKSPESPPTSADLDPGALAAAEGDPSASAREGTETGPGATQRSGAPGGTRTPDPQVRSLVL